jgi:hypothetical protein
MFASVGTVRNAESKVKVERLEEFVFEKVSLNHSKVVNRFVSNRELDPVRVRSVMLTPLTFDRIEVRKMMLTLPRRF